MPVPSSSNSSEVGEDEGIMEALIHEVGLRPPLYDIRLPLKERTPERIHLLWREVYEALEGRIPETDLSAKFKNLRDRYVKEKNVYQCYQPSGSAATKRKKWVHFDSLAYLSDCVQFKGTNRCLDGLVGGGNGDGGPRETPSPRRDNKAELGERLLKETHTKEMDGVHHFCMVVADHLRRRSQDEQLELEIKILEVLRR